MDAMKPRLEPAPPTEEDFAILCYMWPGRDWRREPLYPIGHSIAGDRRDADLMLYAQQHKLVTWVGPPMIHVRNAVSAYWSDPPWQGTLE